MRNEAYQAHVSRIQLIYIYQDGGSNSPSSNTSTKGVKSVGDKLPLRSEDVDDSVDVLTIVSAIDNKGRCSHLPS